MIVIGIGFTAFRIPICRHTWHAPSLFWAARKKTREGHWLTIPWFWRTPWVVNAYSGEDKVFECTIWGRRREQRKNLYPIDVLPYRCVGRHLVLFDGFQVPEIRYSLSEVIQDRRHQKNQPEE